MTEESNSVSPVLKADWFDSRWGKEDQRGNGNLMTREKVLEAVKLIRTGEVVSLGMPYDTRMPIAPGRAYAFRRRQSNSIRRRVARHARPQATTYLARARHSANAIERLCL